MPNPISRRRFVQGSVAAAAAAGFSTRFTAQSYAQIVGANESIRIGVIGFNGRGKDHIDNFRKMQGVRVVALSDADSGVMEKEYERLTKAAAPSNKSTTKPTTRRGDEAVQAAEKVKGKKSSKDDERETAKSDKESGDGPRPVAVAAGPQLKIAKYLDLRKMIEAKDIDAVSTATPNHWHALIAVWACQAGKDVYVEKPVSHNVWEGRKIVEAARKYNRIVQTGTQSRSRSALKEAFEWVRGGKSELGKVLVARGLCYKRRGTIGKYDPATDPNPIPKTVDFDLWCGPAAKDDIRRKKLHYEWHWVWNTGNGDLGNQGIHQMDVARWALGKDHLSPKVFSVGGRLGYEDDGETPNTQFVVHDYGDQLLIFEVRGLPKEPGSLMDKYKGQSVGNIIECENGYLSDTTAYDKDDKEIKKFSGSNGNHYANFIEAVKSRKVTDLNADILEGHLSSALCHTGNISYQLGKTAPPEQIADAVKSNKFAAETYERFAEHLKLNEVDLAKTQATLGAFLEMDPKTERFTNNEKANELLTRKYRAPFVVPENV